MPAPSSYSPLMLIGRRDRRGSSRKIGKIALQYSSTNGFEHFRQQIADRMEAKLNIKPARITFS